MKTNFTIILLLLLAQTAFSQAPQSFNYQSVVRTPAGTPIDGQTVSLEFSILQGSATGEAVYTETHQTTTNSFGIVTLQIGSGTTSDDFSQVNWGEGPYFIQVGVDVDGGNNYLVTTTSQLLSVPFSLHANTADVALSDKVNDADADATNEIQTISKDGDTLILSKDGGRVTLPKEFKVTGVAEEGDMISFDGNNWVAKRLYLAPSGSGHPFNNMQPYLTVNYCIALQGIFPSRNILDPFLGTIAAFGFNFTPRGWAACDGQLIHINQNQALFSLIGVHYGGDGQTTFALPDLRGRTPINYGQGPGLTNKMLGQTGGTETTTLSTNHLPQHTHQIHFAE